jgi:protein-S-isoprenylcysteine O-methyltransferase Ste14
MPLVDEFQRTGNWLFKRRGTLPLLLVVAGLILLFLTDFSLHPAPPAWYKGLCLAVSFAGLLIRIFTIGHTPKHTSGRNIMKQRANQLNTTGIYSVVRHPLYVGNFFIWLGLAMFLGNVWFAVIACLVFWLYYERIMFAEEAFLREKFGDDYLTWASRTPSFIPRFRSYVRPDLPFSMKNVFKREYNARTSLMEGKISLAPAWIIFFLAGFLIWLTIRTLEKTTQLFEVEGR